MIRSNCSIIILQHSGYGLRFFETCSTNISKEGEKRRHRRSINALLNRIAAPKATQTTKAGKYIGTIQKTTSTPKLFWAELGNYPDYCLLDCCWIAQWSCRGKSKSLHTSDPPLRLRRTHRTSAERTRHSAPRRECPGGNNHKLIGSHIKAPIWIN